MEPKKLGETTKDTKLHEGKEGLRNYRRFRNVSPGLPSCTFVSFVVSPRFLLRILCDSVASRFFDAHKTNHCVS
jgi:hypothetical protein